MGFGYIRQIQSAVAEFEVYLIHSGVMAWYTGPALMF